MALVRAIHLPGVWPLPNSFPTQIDQGNKDVSYLVKIKLDVDDLFVQNEMPPSHSDGPKAKHRKADRSNIPTPAAQIARGNPSSAFTRGFS